MLVTILLNWLQHQFMNGLKHEVWNEHFIITSSITPTTHLTGVQQIPAWFFSMTSLLPPALHSGLQTISAYSNFINPSNAKWRGVLTDHFCLANERLDPIREVVWHGQSHKANKWKNKIFSSATATCVLPLIPLRRLWGNQALLQMLLCDWIWFPAPWDSLTHSFSSDFPSEWPVHV